MAQITIDLEDYLDDLDDDLLVREVIRRKLGSKVLNASQGAPLSEEDTCSISSIITHLACKHASRAIEEMHRLINTILPEGLMEAFDLIKAGRCNDAICLLDKIADPSPAATAKTLPRPTITHIDR